MSDARKILLGLLALTTACGWLTPTEVQPAHEPTPKVGPRQGTPPELTPEEQAKPETVVFIVLDTVRAQSMSLCGYHKPTTPYLLKLRQERGLVGTCKAYSPATWTIPSHASYFTGLTPPEHGIDQFGFVMPQDGPKLLAEIMAERGFSTAMIAANNALAKSGLHRGFEHVRIAETMMELRAPDFEPAFERFLEPISTDEPLFLFVNLIDAHDPYPSIPEELDWLPHQPQIRLQVRSESEDGRYHRFLRGELEDPERYLQVLRNAYDYGVYLEDDNVRAVIQGLKKQGRLPGPLRIVVTSDHGEFFGEHQLLRHNAYVWEPVVRVPLFFHDNRMDELPEIRGPMSATTAYHLVLEGALPEPKVTPASWSRYMPDRPVTPGEDMTARWGRRSPKLIWGDAGVRSVDLEGDPEEASLGDPAGHPGLESFEDQVRTYQEHLARTHGAAPDAEALEALRELGYVE